MALLRATIGDGMKYGGCEQLLDFKRPAGPCIYDNRQ